MELLEAGNEHPLLPTAHPKPYEDSVDAGADSEHHTARTVDDYAARIFGVPSIDTQGPAGSRVPDLDERPRHPPRWGGDEEPPFCYPQDPEAPPDAAGPHAPLDADMTEADYGDAAGDAAAAALTAVHRQGRCTSAAMLDAMEAAEASFERQQAAAGRSGASGATGMAGLRRDAAAGGAVAAGHALPPDTPRKAAICEGTRERMVQALFQSLQDNPRYGMEPSRSVMSLAAEVEDSLFASCHSKQVYLNAVSNAVRLARTAPDALDIPRIASGEPRAVAEGHTAGEPSPTAVGLHGFVVKPDLLL